MLASSASAPRVTRCSLGLYWSRDLCSKHAAAETGWLGDVTLSRSDSERQRNLMTQDQCPLPVYYSQSWLTAFSSFFPQKVSFWLPNLANLLGAQLLVQTYISSQLRKMLILLNRSHCKIYPLPTIPNSTNMRDCHCWQWADFTMGPNEQNQHFAELRQKVCLYTHAVVLLRGLPSLEGKNNLFVGKKRKKRLAH